MKKKKFIEDLIIVLMGAFLTILMIIGGLLLSACAAQEPTPQCPIQNDYCSSRWDGYETSRTYCSIETHYGRGQWCFENIEGEIECPCLWASSYWYRCKEWLKVWGNEKDQIRPMPGERL